MLRTEDVIKTKPEAGSYIDFLHPLRQQQGGCWLFNEGGGLYVKDTCRRAADALITGAGWTAGKSGPALNFTATTQTVNLASNPNIDAPGSVADRGVFTVGVRFKTSTDSRYISQFTSTAVGRWWVCIGDPPGSGMTAHKLNLLYRNDGGISTVASGLTTVDNGIWHDGVISYISGGGSTGGIYIYVDGQFESFTSVNSGFGSAYSTSVQNIGSASSSVILGQIEWYQIWSNRAFTRQDVAMFWNDPYAGIIRPSRKRSWRFQAPAGGGGGAGRLLNLRRRIVARGAA